MVEIKVRDIPRSPTMRRTYAPTGDGERLFKLYGMAYVYKQREEVSRALNPGEKACYDGSIWTKNEDGEVVELVGTHDLMGVVEQAVVSLANLQEGEDVVGLRRNKGSSELFVTKTPEVNKARVWISQDDESSQLLIAFLVNSKGLHDINVLGEELEEAPVGTHVLEVDNEGNITKFYNGFIMNFLPRE